MTERPGVRGISIGATVFATNVAADMARGDISNADTTNPMTTGAAIFADHCKPVVWLLRRGNGHGLSTSTILQRVPPPALITASLG
jgi:hypothetical protein